MADINPTTQTLTPFQQAQGGSSSFQFMNGQGYNANGNVVAGPVNPANSVVSGTLPVSTTTLSNDNKQSQAAGIQATTNTLSNTGSVQNPDGSISHSNGTMTPALIPLPAGDTPSPADTTNTAGGWIGDQYYAPNTTPPKDLNGNVQTLTPVSATSKGITDSLNNLKTQSDANTANLIDQLTTQYNQLIDQQTKVNSGQEAGVNMALLHGGVTGAGSSSQYAPISSSGIISNQLAFDTSKIADLQNKKAQAISQAQIAGANQDHQLQDQLNQEAIRIQNEMQASIKEATDKVNTAKQKVVDQQVQQNKDNNVAALYSSGVTDPAQILKTLTGEGLTITAAEVNNSIKNIDPGKAGIQTIAQDAAKAGASADTVKAILASSDPAAALVLATPNMGAAAQATLNAKLFTPPTAKVLGNAQFYKYPSSSVVYSSKGQPVSLQEYKTLTNQTDKADNQVDFSGIKTIQPTTNNPTPAPKKTTPTEKLKDIHNQNDQILSTMTGKAKGDPNGDNYVSPETFNQAADAFVNAKQGTYAQFYNAHKGFANPMDIKRGNIKK